MLILDRWQTVCQFDSLAIIVDFLGADVTPQKLLLRTDFPLNMGQLLIWATNVAD